MTLGILGGGQLSQMLALSGIPLGFDFVFYVPQEEHCVHGLGEVIHGSYEDLASLKTFAERVGVITFENENIPPETLDYLETIKPVFPNRQALAVAQDRLQEKQFFLKVGIPTNRFITVDSVGDVLQAAEELGYPLILKKRCEGYDGKGQFRIASKEDIDTLPEGYCVKVLAEECIHFDREVSVILAKNAQGTVCYDLCKNTHEKGILVKTENLKADPMFDLAYDYAGRIAEELDYVGVLAVEFFQVGDQLIANEMAPRVHNSGHWTLDACITSQFENHVRAIAGLPLGDPASLSSVVMSNIIGTMPDKAELLRKPGLCLHDYKKQPRPGRKLGHVTLVGDNINP